LLLAQHRKGTGKNLSSAITRDLRLGSGAKAVATGSPCIVQVSNAVIANTKEMAFGAAVRISTTKRVKRTRTSVHG